MLYLTEDIQLIGFWMRLLANHDRASINTIISWCYRMDQKVEASLFQQTLGEIKAKNAVKEDANENGSKTDTDVPVSQETVKAILMHMAVNINKNAILWE